MLFFYGNFLSWWKAAFTQLKERSAWLPTTISLRAEKCFRVKCLLQAGQSRSSCAIPPPLGVSLPQNYSLQALYSRIKFPIPGSVWGQVGWGLEQPGLGEDVPAQGTGLYLRSLPTQAFLWWFYEHQGGKCLVWMYPCVSTSVQEHSTPSLATSPFCVPTTTTGIINGPTLSSSHGNAVSKTNNSLLCDNLQIKVHFPSKEERSPVCVSKEGILHLCCHRDEGCAATSRPDFLFFFLNTKWPVRASQREYELAQVNRRSNRQGPKIPLLLCSILC